MKKIHVITLFALFIGITTANNNFEKTDWIPIGDQKFVDASAKVITEIGGKTGHSITVGLGPQTAIVRIDPGTNPKPGWQLDKEKTAYNLGSSGVPHGSIDMKIISQDNNVFTFGFDAKPGKPNNGKSTTVYGQVELTGIHQKTRDVHTDRGISGKDTSVTITLKY